MPFKVCGATCDSVDILSRPFWLPETVDTGDWIEIGHIGAYSMALSTRFNGFYPDTFVEVTTPFDEGRAPERFRQPRDDGGVDGHAGWTSRRSLPSPTGAALNLYGQAPTDRRSGSSRSITGWPSTPCAISASPAR